MRILPYFQSTIALGPGTVAVWGRLPSLPVHGASVPRVSCGKMPPEPADKMSAPQVHGKARRRAMDSQSRLAAPPPRAAGLSELAIIAFTELVQFQLNPCRPEQNTCSASLLIGQRQVPLALVRNPRARRYLLRLRRDGVARVTIPRGGSIAEAKAFAERNAAWLERQLHRLAAQSTQLAPWRIGSEIFFRGETVLIEAGLDDGPATIRIGSECLRVSETASDLRRAIEICFRQLADRELPPRVFEQASLHQLTVHRVSVRNQRSRWGSCSRRGTISLNWRLIQTPAFVRDYIILHELMHLRQMNHSSRFWREVERVCPDYKAAEHWLKAHSGLLTQ